MRVLMLGWEFPPFITGGLGTACFGMTKALDQIGVKVTFVLPTAVGQEHAAHVDLVSPATASIDPGVPGIVFRPGTGGSAAAGDPPPVPLTKRPEFKHAEFLSVESEIVHPYPQGDASGAPGTVGAPGTPGSSRMPGASGAPGSAGSSGIIDEGSWEEVPGVPAPPAQEYGGDLINQVERYANFCLAAAQQLDFDVIHAHDWLTYPAGLWIARATGKPLVVHVHSTEFDRSGEHVNQRVYDIERRGMHGAMRVVCVSQLTKNVVVHRYGVPEEHVDVVYNGVDIDTESMGLQGIQRKDKIVLYFGRITFQKGPEYFLRAAKRVLEVMDDVMFVVAGSGDMARHMIELAAHMGIGHRVLFTGFLRGDDIKKVFSLADLYVMPSVSEPFGIAPLEAMSHDVPVIISRSSGVSEVLSHALKVDFWDVDDMANKIVAVLKHPPLSQTLREHGAFEVRKLTWEGAAKKCETVYQKVLDDMAPVAGLHR